MRRLATLLVTTVMATGLAFSVGAAPAHAEILQGVYSSGWECNRVGNYGISEGWWTSYRCVPQTFPQYTLWFLYA